MINTEERALTPSPYIAVVKIPELSSHQGYADLLNPVFYNPLPLLKEAIIICLTDF